MHLFAVSESISSLSKLKNVVNTFFYLAVLVLITFPPLYRNALPLERKFYSEEKFRCSF